MDLVHVRRWLLLGMRLSAASISQWQLHGFHSSWASDIHLEKNQLWKSSELSPQILKKLQNSHGVSTGESTIWSKRLVSAFCTMNRSQLWNSDGMNSSLDQKTSRSSSLSKSPSRASDTIQRQLGRVYPLSNRHPTCSWVIILSLRRIAKIGVKFRWSLPILSLQGRSIQFRSSSIQTLKPFAISWLLEVSSLSPSWSSSCAGSPDVEETRDVNSPNCPSSPKLQRLRLLTMSSTMPLMVRRSHTSTLLRSSSSPEDNETSTRRTLT